MAVLDTNANKKYLFAACAALILVIGGYLYFTRTPEITNIDSRGTSIVAFGDSLVRGVGSTPGNDFVSLLSGKIGLSIINLGTSGDTTETALARIDTIDEHNPKIVIVLLGGNDYLRRVPIDRTFENLGQIIDRIHARGSAVLLLGVRGGLLRDTYNARFSAFAKNKRVGFVPNVLDEIIGKKELMSDAIHPNDAGYQLIADKVRPVLQKMLRENARKLREL